MLVAVVVAHFIHDISAQTSVLLSYCLPSQAWQWWEGKIN